MLWVMAAACMLAWANVRAQPASAESNVRAGHEAFINRQYAVAIQHYLQAYRSGNQSPELFHNLAVAFYRNQNYVEAMAVFNRLSQVPRFTALAYLNLALVAVKQQQWEQARSYLQAISHVPTTQIVLTHAATLTQRVEQKIAETKQGEAGMYVFTSTGAEDHVQAYQEQDVGQARVNTYNDMNIYYTRYLSRVRQNDLQWNASVYGLNNKLEETQDLAFVSLGLELEYAWNSWKRRWSTSSSLTLLDGKPFQAGIDILYSLKRTSITGWALEAANRAQYLQGVQIKDGSLDGGQNQLRVSVLKQTERSKNRIELEWEYSLTQADRIDASTPVFSPMRYRIRVDNQIGYGRTVRSLLRYEYRRSSDEFFNGEHREDQRHIVLLRMSKDIGQSFELAFEYEYRDQVSNLTIHSFKRNAGAVQLNWQRHWP